MVLSLTATGIQSDATDTGTYTWDDVIALNSPKLIAHTTTNSKTIYRWTGLLVLNGTAILTINSQTVEFLRLAVDGGSRGQVYLNNSAKLIISSSTILVTYYDFTYREDDSRCLLRSQSATASIEIYESNIAFGAASNPINISGGSKMEIQASLMRNCSCTVPDQSYETAIVKIKPDSSAISNTLLNLVDCSVNSTTATSANFSNISSYGALNAFTNWGAANGFVLRDFRASGSPVNDYFADTTTYTTFVDCEINLANGQVMKNNLVLAQGNYKKGASHNLKLTDSTGNISNALVRYIGRTNVSAVSSSGSVSEFILIFQETNLIGQPDPGLAYAVYPKPLAILDFSAYTREVRSYLHNGRSELITVGDKIGSIALPFEISLSVDSGITQTVQATAAAATGIAHTATAITVSISRSIAEIYDSRKAYWRDNGGTPGVRIGTIADFGNLNITIATGAAISPSTAKFADGVQTSGIFTLTDPRAYNGVPFSVASGGSVVVSTGDTDLRSWIFAAGTVINISGAGSALVTVSATQLANVTAGAGVTLQAPVASISAPNFAQNTRVQVARLEPYSVPSTAIATATSIITIAGNRFKSAAPATLVYFQLQAGATIPTTSPQIANNTLYFVQASGVSDGLAAGQFKISLTQSGAAIAFSSQGTGNFTLTGITELDNSLAGAGGYSVAFTEPNGTLLRVSAQSWQNASGCTAGNFYQQSLIWNSTGGNAIADTVSISAKPDTIHNSLIGNSARVFNTNVTLPSDGSTVTGISFNAQGIISLDPRSFASVAGFPTITPQAAYLYTVYYRSTAAGIRVIANQFSAQDAANFAFSGLKLDNIADGIRNTPNTAAMIAGGYIATIDGSNPIAPASGAIYLNADRRGVLVTTTSAGSIAPTQQQLRDAQALTLSAGVVAATGSIDSKLALIPTSDNAPFVAAIKGQTDKLAFTTANRVDSTAIGVPTNPLITTDSRLNNLDALVSSRASQTALNAIPTNPVLITDSRLSNLDALVSSRATQASINALPTLAAIEGSIVLFKINNYTAPDNAGIGSLNSKLTTIRTDGLDRLPNLDALITSRATPDQVWAVPYSGLTQTGTIGRMLYWVGKLFGATPAAVTASKTARSTSDGTINQTITTNPDGSKTMSGNP